MNPQSANKFLLAIWLFATVGLLLFIGQSTSLSDHTVTARTLLLGLSAASIAVPLGGVLAWVCLGQRLDLPADIFGHACLDLCPGFSARQHLGCGIWATGLVNVGRRSGSGAAGIRLVGSGLDPRHCRDSSSRSDFPVGTDDGEARF